MFIRKLYGKEWIRYYSKTQSSLLISRLEKYSRFKPTPLSIRNFLDFGQNSNPKTSFQFLLQELPIRLAGTMNEIRLLPSELQKTRNCQRVKEYYEISFMEILNFEKQEPTRQVLNKFSETLEMIYIRHADIVTMMAEALLEVKNKIHDSSFERNVNYFLDRMYTSRISNRMLISQHGLLFHSKAPSENGFVGSINPSCNIGDVVKGAYEAARFMAEQYYMSSAPSLELESFETWSSTINPVISCIHVPSHLHHILFELFKNAMRATVETHCKSDVLPSLKVRITKGTEDISIQLDDLGGGIPRRLIQKIFQYSYTTAPNPSLSTSSTELPSFGTQNVPLAGLGYGLPLSRLYARYFAGDLELYSLEGYGTSSIVYICADSTDAIENIPVYHETGSRKIYEAPLLAHDWTSKFKKN